MMERDEDPLPDLGEEGQEPSTMETWTDEFREYTSKLSVMETVDFYQFFETFNYGAEISERFFLSGGHQHLHYGAVARRDPDSGLVKQDHLIILVDLDAFPGEVPIPSEAWQIARNTIPESKPPYFYKIPRITELHIPAPKKGGIPEIPYEYQHLYPQNENPPVRVVLASRKRGVVVKARLDLLFALAQDRVLIRNLSERDWKDHITPIVEELYQCLADIEMIKKRWTKEGFSVVDELDLTLSVHPLQVAQLARDLQQGTIDYLKDLVEEAWILRVDGKILENFREGDVLRGKPFQWDCLYATPVVYPRHESFREGEAVYATSDLLEDWRNNAHARRSPVIGAPYFICYDFPPTVMLAIPQHRWNHFQFAPDLPLPRHLAPVPGYEVIGEDHLYTRVPAHPGYRPELISWVDADPNVVAFLQFYQQVVGRTPDLQVAMRGLLYFRDWDAPGGVRGVLVKCIDGLNEFLAYSGNLQVVADLLTPHGYPLSYYTLIPGDRNEVREDSPTLVQYGLKAWTQPVYAHLLHLIHNLSELQKTRLARADLLLGSLLSNPVVEERACKGSEPWGPGMVRGWWRQHPETGEYGTLFDEEGFEKHCAMRAQFADPDYEDPWTRLPPWERVDRLEKLERTNPDLYQGLLDYKAQLDEVDEGKEESPVSNDTIFSEPNLVEPWAGHTILHEDANSVTYEDVDTNEIHVVPAGRQDEHVVEPSVEGQRVLAAKINLLQRTPEYWRQALERQRKQKSMDRIARSLLLVLPKPFKMDDPEIQAAIKRLQAQEVQREQLVRIRDKARVFATSRKSPGAPERKKLAEDNVTAAHQDDPQGVVAEIVQRVMALDPQLFSERMGSNAQFLTKFMADITDPDKKFGRKEKYEVPTGFPFRTEKGGLRDMKQGKKAMDEYGQMTLGALLHDPLLRGAIPRLVPGTLFQVRYLDARGDVESMGDSSQTGLWSFHPRLFGTGTPTRIHVGNHFPAALLAPAQAEDANSAMGQGVREPLQWLDDRAGEGHANVAHRVVRGHLEQDSLLREILLPEKLQEALESTGDSNVGTGVSVPAWLRPLRDLRVGPDQTPVIAYIVETLGKRGIGFKAYCGALDRVAETLQSVQAPLSGVDARQLAAQLFWATGADLKLGLASFVRNRLNLHRDAAWEIYDLLWEATRRGIFNFTSPDLDELQYYFDLIDAEGLAIEHTTDALELAQKFPLAWNQLAPAKGISISGDQGIDLSLKPLLRAIVNARLDGVFTFIQESWNRNHRLPTITEFRGRARDVSQPWGWWQEKPLTKETRGAYSYLLNRVGPILKYTRAVIAGGAIPNGKDDILGLFRLYFELQWILSQYSAGTMKEEWKSIPSVAGKIADALVIPTMDGESLERALQDFAKVGRDASHGEIADGLRKVAVIPATSEEETSTRASVVEITKWLRKAGEEFSWGRLAGGILRMLARYFQEIPGGDAIDPRLVKFASDLYDAVGRSALPYFVYARALVHLYRTEFDYVDPREPDYADARVLDVVLQKKTIPLETVKGSILSTLYEGGGGSATTGSKCRVRVSWQDVVDWANLDILPLVEMVRARLGTILPTDGLAELGLDADSVREKLDAYLKSTTGQVVFHEYLKYGVERVGNRLLSYILKGTTKKKGDAGKARGIHTDAVKAYNASGSALEALRDLQQSFGKDTKNAREVFARVGRQTAERQLLRRAYQDHFQKHFTGVLEERPNDMIQFLYHGRVSWDVLKTAYDSANEDDPAAGPLRDLKWDFSSAFPPNVAWTHVRIMRNRCDRLNKVISEKGKPPRREYESFIGERCDRLRFREQLGNLAGALKKKRESEEEKDYVQTLFEDGFLPCLGLPDAGEAFFATQRPPTEREAWETLVGVVLSDQNLHQRFRDLFQPYPHIPLDQTLAPVPKDPGPQPNLVPITRNQVLAGLVRGLALEYERQFSREVENSPKDGTSWRSRTVHAKFLQLARALEIMNAGVHFTAFFECPGIIPEPKFLSLYGDILAGFVRRAKTLQDFKERIERDALACPSVKNSYSNFDIIARLLLEWLGSIVILSEDQGGGWPRSVPDFLEVMESDGTYPGWAKRDQALQLALESQGPLSVAEKITTKPGKYKPRVNSLPLFHLAGASDRGSPYAPLQDLVEDLIPQDWALPTPPITVRPAPLAYPLSESRPSLQEGVKLSGLTRDIRAGDDFNIALNFKTDKYAKQPTIFTIHPPGANARQTRVGDAGKAAIKKTRDDLKTEVNLLHGPAAVAWGAEKTIARAYSKLLAIQEGEERLYRLLLATRERIIAGESVPSFEDLRNDPAKDKAGEPVVDWNNDPITYETYLHWNLFPRDDQGKIPDFYAEVAGGNRTANEIRKFMFGNTDTYLDPTREVRESVAGEVPGIPADLPTPGRRTVGARGDFNKEVKQAIGARKAQLGRTVSQVGKRLKRLYRDLERARARYTRVNEVPATWNDAPPDFAQVPIHETPEGRYLLRLVALYALQEAHPFERFRKYLTNPPTADRKRENPELPPLTLRVELPKTIRRKIGAGASIAALSVLPTHYPSRHSYVHVVITGDRDIIHPVPRPVQELYALAGDSTVAATRSDRAGGADQNQPNCERTVVVGVADLVFGNGSSEKPTAVKPIPTYAPLDNVQDAWWRVMNLWDCKNGRILTSQVTTHTNTKTSRDEVQKELEAGTKYLARLETTRFRFLKRPTPDRPYDWDAETVKRNLHDWLGVPVKFWEIKRTHGTDHHMKPIKRKIRKILRLKLPERRGSGPYWGRLLTRLRRQRYFLQNTNTNLREAQGQALLYGIAHIVFKYHLSRLYYESLSFRTEGQRGFLGVVTRKMFSGADYFNQVKRWVYALRGEDKTFFLKTAPPHFTSQFHHGYGTGHGEAHRLDRRGHTDFGYCMDRHDKDAERTGLEYFTGDGAIVDDHLNAALNVIEAGLGIFRVAPPLEEEGEEEAPDEEDLPDD